MANLNITPLKYQPTTHQAPLTEHGARVDLIKNGYCPDCGFQLRKKTFLGRWKTLHEVCPRIESHSTIQSPAMSATLPIQTTSNFQIIQSYQNASPAAISSPVPTMASATAEPASTPSHPPANQVQRKRFCDDGVWGEYVGELDPNGIRSGRGEMTWENGKVYDGEWKDDKADGRGTYRWANGDVYDGEVKNDKKDGRGTYRWADGHVYEGEWKDDAMDGRGTRRWADGKVYEGEWKDGKWKNGKKMDGQGTGTYIRYANGDVYVGERKDNKMNGQGTFRFANGDMYKGEWKDNEKVRGTYRDASGNVYEGEYKNDKKDGRGTFRWANGELEVGMYKAGLDFGEGVRWSKDRWTAWLLKDGKIVRKIRPSEAKATAKRIGFPDAPEVKK